MKGFSFSGMQRHSACREKFDCKSSLKLVPRGYLGSSISTERKDPPTNPPILEDKVNGPSLEV